MSKKIFRAIWIVVLAVIAASLIFILDVSYHYFAGLQQRQLKNETLLTAHGVALSGDTYFKDLQDDGYRITWIAPDGTVLYDSGVSTEQMENHLEREEVQKALKDGYGESSRYSRTLAYRQLYAAQKLPDGTILRMSVEYSSVWTLVLGLAQPICAVLMIALVLSLVLASRMAKKIVKPINEIDVDNPLQYLGKEEFAEIEPLLRKIAQQQKEIKEGLQDRNQDPDPDPSPGGSLSTEKETEDTDDP